MPTDSVKRQALFLYDNSKEKILSAHRSLVMKTGFKVYFFLATFLSNQSPLLKRKNSLH